MRHGGAATFSLESAASEAGHLRRGAGFVDEDQAMGVEVRLSCEPRLAPGRDVGALLLGCVRCFYGMAHPSFLLARLAGQPEEEGTERCRLLSWELILAKTAAVSSVWMRQEVSFCGDAFTGRASLS